MALKPSLTTKAAILLAVPLAVQIALFGILAKLQLDLESETRAIEQPIEIIFDLTVAYKNLLRTSLGAARAHIDYLTSQEFEESKNETFEKLEQLKKLLKNSPAEWQVLDRTRQHIVDALRVMEQNEDSIADSIENKGIKARVALAPVAKMMGAVYRSAQEVPVIIDNHTSQAYQILDRFHAGGCRYERVLICGIALEALLIIISAAWWSRHISTRIRTIKDNTYRIASHEALLPRLQGGDELARLDQVMHNTAEALIESQRNQQALAQNARDVICSLDERLTFLGANLASAVVFGYQPQDLLRMKLASLLLPSETAAALSLFQSAKNRSQDFELRMTRKDQTIIESLWSVRWSPADQAYYCVVHDNTTRKQSERQRNELVQLISQDLKVPLATLVDSLTSLEVAKSAMLSERGQQLLTVARSATAQMLTLVNDLLDIEKIETGSLKINLAHCSLAPLFEQAKLGVTGLAQKHKVKIETEANNVTVTADSDRLVQILVNLMSNAVKFSPPGGTVLVRAKAGKEIVEVEVVDEGRGIPKDKLSSVFDRFKQVSASDATRKGGSGLGLAICKALVQMHGGDIKVDSHEGKGSVFSFWLPRDPLAADKAPPARQRK